MFSKSKCRMIHRQRREGQSSKRLNKEMRKIISKEQSFVKQRNATNCGSRRFALNLKGSLSNR